jgi:aspartyl/glutamyl-tRNA(Asn/Gln) amidotransferase C subunit
MDKLDVLSNIDTKNLEIKEITSFFEKVKAVNVSNSNVQTNRIAKPENLRSDEVKHASQVEKDLIMQNFPKKQGTYLVVPKVIQ